MNINGATADSPINDAQIDRIVQNLVAIMPIFHRKLLRMDLGGVTGQLTRLHLGVMASLNEGRMTASELAKDAVMPKSQVTHLIDHLAQAGIVSRHPDLVDRRVVNIELTQRGHVLLEDTRQKVQETIRQELSVLTERELTEMSAALDTLRRIGARL